MSRTCTNSPSWITAFRRRELGDEPQQLLVDRTVLGPHRRDEVHVEQEAPQGRGRVGIGRDQVTHRELVRRHVAAPVVLDRVDRVAVDGAVVSLVHRIEARMLLVARRSSRIAFHQRSSTAIMPGVAEASAS